MKFQQLKHKSIPIGGGLRMRLARPSEDQEFIERMNSLAGAQRSSERIARPRYQAGIRAALEARGGYWLSVHGAFNETGENTADLGMAISSAIDAASFDLVAVKDGDRVGLVSVGAGYDLVTNLLKALGQLGQHQVVSLLMGLPKLVSISIVDEDRGRGYGAVLLSATMELVSRMGCVGLYGECQDDAGLVRFYEAAGMTVLDAGQHLNVFPVAGRHVVTRREENPALGPFLAAEPGFRIFYGLGGHPENPSEKMLAQLNSPSQRSL